MSPLLDRLNLVFDDHGVGAGVLPHADRPLHPDRLGLEHDGALGLLDHPQLGQPRPHGTGVGDGAGTAGNTTIKSQQ